jgi:hypothetical protein
VRPDPRELLLRQPETISIHRRLPEKAVNHESAVRSNGFMGPGP